MERRNLAAVCFWESRAVEAPRGGEEAAENHGGGSGGGGSEGSDPAGE